MHRVINDSSEWIKDIDLPYYGCCLDKTVWAVKFCEVRGKHVQRRSPAGIKLPTLCLCDRHSIRLATSTPQNWPAWMKIKNENGKCCRHSCFPHINNFLKYTINTLGEYHDKNKISLNEAKSEAGKGIWGVHLGYKLRKACSFPLAMWNKSMQCLCASACAHVQYVCVRVARARGCACTGLCDNKDLVGESHALRWQMVKQLRPSQRHQDWPTFPALKNGTDPKLRAGRPTALLAHKHHHIHSQTQGHWATQQQIWWERNMSQGHGCWHINSVGRACNENTDSRPGPISLILLDWGLNWCTN